MICNLPALFYFVKMLLKIEQQYRLFFSNMTFVFSLKFKYILHSKIAKYI